jgi:hypothetical protein
MDVLHFITIKHLYLGTCPLNIILNIFSHLWGHHRDQSRTRPELLTVAKQVLYMLGMVAGTLRIEQHDTFTARYTGSL